MKTYIHTFRDGGTLRITVNLNTTPIEVKSEPWILPDEKKAECNAFFEASVFPDLLRNGVFERGMKEVR